MRSARSALVVCMGALRQHESALDAEVANVLARTCAAKIELSLATVDALLAKPARALLRSSRVGYDAPAPKADRAARGTATTTTKRRKP